MKITTDLTGTENAATRHARLKAIYDFYFGTGAYVAAGNLGVARAALNGLLTNDIANGETFASWLVKANWLNDLDTAIPSLIFTGGHKGIVIDPEVLSSMSQDTAGATPVTAAGQPVGRILDRSGNALHPVQATAAAKPTYQLDGSSRPLLRLDGVDDKITTPSFDWLTDAMTVIAAFRKNLDTPRGNIANFGSAGVNGIWQLCAPGGPDKVISIVKGTVQSTAATTSVTYSAPISMVLTNTADISADSIVLRVNGTQVATSTADLGTGNFSNQAIRIGESPAATLFANGDLYGLMAVNRVLTATEIGFVERWMALKSGVTLP